MKTPIEISLRDKMIIFAYPVIGMILILFVAYDPLNLIDNPTHQTIIALIVATIPFIGLFYHRKKIMEKTKKPNIIEISRRDILILFLYPVIGMILLLFIGYDPLNLIDNPTHQTIIAFFVPLILFVPLFYHRKKIMEKAKKEYP